MLLSVLLLGVRGELPEDREKRRKGEHAAIKVEADREKARMFRAHELEARRRQQIEMQERERKMAEHHRHMQAEQEKHHRSVHEETMRRLRDDARRARGEL